MKKTQRNFSSIIFYSLVFLIFLGLSNIPSLKAEEPTTDPTQSSTPSASPTQSVAPSASASPSTSPTLTPSSSPTSSSIPSVLPSVTQTSGGGSSALQFSEPEVYKSGKLAELKDIKTAIPALFSIVVYVSGVIFIILFLIGGLQYLTAAGNEEATKKAMKLLVDAVIGIVIVLVAWAAGSWILTLLGIM